MAMSIFHTIKAYHETHTSENALILTNMRQLLQHCEKSSSVDDTGASQYNLPDMYLW